MDDMAQIARFLQTHKVRVTTTPPPFEPRVSDDDTHLRQWNMCVQWIHSAVKHFSGTNDDDEVHRALCLFGRLVQIEAAKSAKSIDAIPYENYRNTTFVALILSLKWTSKMTRISDIVDVLMNLDPIDDAAGLMLVTVNAKSSDGSYDGGSSDESSDTPFKCSESLMHASYIAYDGSCIDLGYFCDKRQALRTFLLHKYSCLELRAWFHLRGTIDVVVGPELARDLLRLMFSDRNFRHVDQGAIYKASVVFLSRWRHDPNLCNVQVQVCTVAACERAIEESDVGSSGVEWRARWDHDVVPHLLGHES